MSQWTHVCGCIRYDWVPAILPPPPFTKILGTPGDYDHMDRIDNIPTGSEGSIQYKVLRTGKENALSVYTVPIWGDLRAFGMGEIDEIKDWFTRITKGKFELQGKMMPPLVRDAVLNIDVEGEPMITLQYDREVE